MQSPTAASCFSAHTDVLEAPIPEYEPGRAALLDELKRRGKAAFGAKEWPDAAALYLQALQVMNSSRSGSDPQESQQQQCSILNANLSLCHAKMHHLDKALETAERATKQDESYVKGWWRLGQAHAALLQYQDAAQAMDRALQLEPDNKTLQKELAKYRTALQEKQAQPEVESVTTKPKDNSVQADAGPLDSASLMPEPAQRILALSLDLFGEPYLKPAASNEREHVAPKLADHSKVLQFEDEIGLRDTVLKLFDGSYARFTQYARVYTSAPVLSWEKCLIRAVSQFYWLSNEQVGCLPVHVRSQLMVVGDENETESHLLSKINEMRRTVDAVTGGDDAEDSETRAFKLKKVHEKFGKDLIDLVNNQNAYGNARQTHLQTIRGETAEKYCRVGGSFTLFFARNLQIVPKDHDTNARWWHLVGRPTLEHCWAELEDHETYSQTKFDPILSSATTVVMKLLLLPLELEAKRPEDYSYQNDPRLPISSLFILCRTIYIERSTRNPQFEEYDGSDEDGDIAPDEDGSCIIRPTSPGRAQAAAIAMMNVFQLAVGSGMMHAALSNDTELQGVLWSPVVFSKSHAVQDLAYRMKIARSHAKLLRKGDV